MTHDPQIAALREEIRRAGRRIGTLRVAAWALLILELARGNLPYLLCGLPDNAASLLAYLWRLLLFLGVAALVAGWLIVPFLAFLRVRSRTAFQRELQGLTPGERATVLAPLAADTSGDTRKIAKSLLRELVSAHKLGPVVRWDGPGGAATPMPGPEAPDHRAGQPDSPAPQERPGRRQWQPYVRRAAGVLWIGATAFALAVACAVPLIPVGNGLSMRVPLSPWEVDVYNTGPLSPVPSDSTVPAGLARREVPIFLGSWETRYSLRCGPCVWEISRNQ